MKPLFARVLLERPKAEKIGNIHVPKESQRRLATLRCKVIAVGDNCEDEIKELIGRDVLIGRFAGDWMNIEGIPGLPDDGTKEYFICQEEDILVAL